MCAKGAASVKNFVVIARLVASLWPKFRRGVDKAYGQLAQPNEPNKPNAHRNQDTVFSKRAAFVNSLKIKVGHIMANLRH